MTLILKKKTLGVAAELDIPTAVPGYGGWGIDLLTVPHLLLFRSGPNCCVHCEGLEIQQNSGSIYKVLFTSSLHAKCARIDFALEIQVSATLVDIVHSPMRFCIGALNTKLIVILGHTNCGAVKGATSQYLKNKGSTPSDPCLEAVAFDCRTDQTIRFQGNLVMAQKGRSAWISCSIHFS